ncbi:hypothetical protein NJ7G_4063 [Natrinema sp. J7-2]|nr:hypothetical protein NJ7G_4063 [Natrinema sp. J7-2]
MSAASTPPSSDPPPPGAEREAGPLLSAGGERNWRVLCEQRGSDRLEPMDARASEHNSVLSGGHRRSSRLTGQKAPLVLAVGNCVTAQRS